MDGWGNTVLAGQSYLCGLFLELQSGSGKHYKLLKKLAFFYTESVVYPFIQMEVPRKGFELSTEEFLQITKYIEETGLNSL